MTAGRRAEAAAQRKHLLRDLSMLFYLQMIPLKMKDGEIKRLLRENYEDAKASRT